MSYETIKDILLPADCNFSLSFREAEKRNVRFVFKNDEQYPLLCSDEAPICLSVIGRLRKRSVLLLSSKGMEQSHYDAAMLFAYEASYAGYDVILKEGTFSYTARSLADDGRAPVIFLSSGILEMKSRRRHILLEGGGGVISPFLPYQIKSKESLMLSDWILAFFPVIVLFGVSRFEYRIALDALDNGADVYLHISSLSYPLARKLALEGVPVMDHVENRNGLVYRNENGSCSFLQF